MRSMIFGGVCVVAAWATAPASTEPETGDQVLYWHEVLQTAQTGSPTVQSRGNAMVSVALHDAVNASLNNPNMAYTQNVAASGGDTRAAAAVAARNVLANLNPGKTADFDAALAASISQVAGDAAKAAEALGARRNMGSAKT